MSALDHQEGGGHYKDMRIQPVEFIHANRLPFLEGNVIKYLSRWKVKNGIQDLLKARHYIDLLIELETKDPSHDANLSATERPASDSDTTAGVVYTRSESASAVLCTGGVCGDGQDVLHEGSGGPSPTGPHGVQVHSADEQSGEGITRDSWRSLDYLRAARADRYNQRGTEGGDGGEESKPE